MSDDVPAFEWPAASFGRRIASGEDIEPGRRLAHAEAVRGLQRGGIEVKLIHSPSGEEAFILCRSRDRRGKERAMHDRFVSRIGKGLDAIQKDLRRAKRPRDRGKLERRIGGLLARNSRAAKA
jgi:hypothetical protein